MPLDKRTAAKLAGLVLALTLVVFGAAKWSRPAPHASPPTPALAATGGTGVGPAQDATGQAINLKRGATPIPCGGTGVGPLQDATMQCVYTAISGGSAAPTTVATVVSGATYTLLATDGFIRFDTSGGSRATANMVAAAYMGQAITFYWWNWSIAQVPPVINAPGGATITPCNGQQSAGAGGLVSSSFVPTPGSSCTLKWDGTEWTTP